MRGKLLVLLISALLIFLTACETDNVSCNLPIPNDSAVLLDNLTTVNQTQSNTITSAVVKDDLLRKEVVEGQKISFPNLKAVDPDGDKLTYKFSKPLNERGEWQTKVGDAGDYKVTIMVSDGKNNASQEVLIKVNPANRAPKIDVAKELKVKEGELVTLDVRLTDPDGDSVKLDISGWMTDKTKQTTFEDSGTHQVVLKATDGKLSSTETLRVIVQNVNRPPKLDPIIDLVVKEGEKVVIKPSAADPDNDKLKFTFSAPLDKNGEWQTKIGDAQNYRVNVTVSDGEFTDTLGFLVSVAAVNRPPVIDVAKTITVNEGETVKLNAKVTDPEEKPVKVEYSGWMTSDTYTTNYNDAGTHKVTITASDEENKATAQVTVVVKDVNRPPTFNPDAFR